MQSKLWSFIESWVNVAFGAGIALLSQLILFPFYNIHVDFLTNIELTIWFTFVSVARSYCVRRWFNNFHLRKTEFEHKPIQKI